MQVQRLENECELDLRSIHHHAGRRERMRDYLHNTAFETRPAISDIFEMGEDMAMSIRIADNKNQLDRRRQRTRASESAATSPLERWIKSVRPSVWRGGADSAGPIGSPPLHSLKIGHGYTKKKKSMPLSKVCRTVADSPLFTSLVMCAVLVIGIIEVLETDIGPAQWMLLTNTLILCYFTFEVVIKIGAEGRMPKRYFRDNWNRFDFCIVTFAWIGRATPLGSTSFLRLLRLLRFVRLWKECPVLITVSQALLNAVHHVGSVDETRNDFRLRRPRDAPRGHDRSLP